MSHLIFLDTVLRGHQILMPSGPRWFHITEPPSRKLAMRRHRPLRVLFLPRTHPQTSLWPGLPHLPGARVSPGHGSCRPPSMVGPVTQTWGVYVFIFRALLMVWVFLRKSPQWSPHPFPDYLCSPSVLGPWSAFPRVLLRSRRPKGSFPTLVRRARRVRPRSRS